MYDVFNKKLAINYLANGERYGEGYYSSLIGSGIRSLR